MCITTVLASIHVLGHPRGPTGLQMLYEMDRVLGRSVHNLCLSMEKRTVKMIFIRILSQMETGGCHCGRRGLPS